MPISDADGIKEDKTGTNGDGYNSSDDELIDGYYGTITQTQMSWIFTRVTDLHLGSV
jgi:hypothetical protein